MEKLGLKIHVKKKEKASRRRMPGWLDRLLKRTFFGVCEEHPEVSKNEVKMYCIDCGHSMCTHCVEEAPPFSCPRIHRLLQIRRYVYQDVIQIHDLQKLLDCSKVQPFTVNSAKVVLLNKKRPSKPSKANSGATSCLICRQSITEPNCYCSIACKVSAWTDEITGDDNDDGINDSNQSQPYISALASDLGVHVSQGELDPSSYPSSPRPSDSGELRWIERALRPRTRIARRKGFPRRAPIF